MKTGLSSREILGLGRRHGQAVHRLEQARSFDVHVGGVFRVRFRTLDGQEHEACGEYLQVVRPDRLVMTWRYALGGEPEELGHTSRIEIDLKPVAGGTELTFTHADLRNEASRISHERGWTGSLAKLVRRLADT